MKIQSWLSYASMFALVFNMGYAEAKGKKKKKAKAPAAAAEDSEEEPTEKVKYEQPFGMAGCGMGSSIITSKARPAQFFVSLFNLTSVETNSFAMSSGSSNCVELKPVLAKQEQQVFVTANLADLSKEAAQGNGEHLEGLAEVLGCPHLEFSQMSQMRYTHIFSEYEADAVLENYLKEVNANDELAKSCVRAG